MINNILVSLLMQSFLFIPFYIIWRIDCKKIGKDNLAVNLKKRFLYWCIFCPIWLFGFLNSTT